MQNNLLHELHALQGLPHLFLLPNFLTTQGSLAINIGYCYVQVALINVKYKESVN